MHQVYQIPRLFMCIYAITLILCVQVFLKFSDKQGEIECWQVTTSFGLVSISSLTPFLPSLNRLIANLAEGMGLVPELSYKQILEETKHSPALSATTSACPSCKREVRSGWKHCVFCGTSLIRICPRCGTPGAEMEGARFCFACGSPLA